MIALFLWVLATDAMLRKDRSKGNMLSREPTYVPAPSQIRQYLSHDR